MADYTWFRPAEPVTPDRVRGPIAALRDGILRDRIRVEGRGWAWSLHRTGARGGPPMTIYLEDGALCWPRRPAPEDEWLLQCIGCQVARAIDPGAVLTDDAGGGPFPADFDRRYPTFSAYMTRRTGNRLLDALVRVVAALVRDPEDDAIRMTAAPF